MYWLTKAHDQHHEHAPKVRMGTRVPNEGVNLAYTYIPLPSPKMNVQILDTTPYITANRDYDDYIYLCTPDTAGLLCHNQASRTDKKYEIPGQVMNVTNKFVIKEDGEPDLSMPLFYRHVLTYYIAIQNGPSSRARYTGTGILIETDRASFKDRMHYEIYVVPTGFDNLYTVEIFTDMGKNPKVTYKAIYNGIFVDLEHAGRRSLMDDYEETLNPVLYFERQKTPPTKEFAYYQGFDFNPNKGKIYVKRPGSGVIYYAVKAVDRKKIKILEPIDTGAMENWYLRIQNGYFEREVSTENGTRLFAYFIPGYYKQDFVANEPPRRRVYEEKAIIIDRQHIRVKHTPLVVPNAAALSIKINNKTVKALEWNINTGIIRLEAILLESDSVKIDYTYEDYAYTYRSYFNDENSSRYFLDLNPGMGHISTITVDGEAQEMPSFKLLNRIIYIYLRAAAEINDLELETNEQAKIKQQTVDPVTTVLELAHPAAMFMDVIVMLDSDNTTINYKDPYKDEIQEGEVYWHWGDDLENLENEEGTFSQTIVICNRPLEIDNYGNYKDRFVISYYKKNPYYEVKMGTFRNEVIEHRFSPYGADGTDIPTDAILLGEVYIRTHVSIEDILLKDTRSRGGGVKPALLDEIDKYEPASSNYWDIGIFDGKPYYQTGVGIVKVPRTVLKQYGGQFTEQDVEKAVYQYMAFGNVALIEYTNDPTILIERPKNLTVDLKPVTAEDAIMVTNINVTVEEVED